MHIEILQKLNTARRKKQAVVLISCLQTGEQSLFSREGTIAGFDPSSGDAKVALQALLSGRCQKSEGEGRVLFFNPFHPPLRMIIIGAVHITQALVSLARHCAYHVTVIDPREAFASRERFPDIELSTDWPDKAMEELQPDARTAVITLAHDPKLDDPALAVALHSQAFYIGALGSRKTQQARQERLAAQGFTEQQRSRIHGPAGLDIGAQSPAEIAVSIMAEITSSLHLVTTP